MTIYLQNGVIRRQSNGAIARSSDCGCCNGGATGTGCQFCFDGTIPSTLRFVIPSGGWKTNSPCNTVANAPVGTFDLPHVNGSCFWRLNNASVVNSCDSWIYMTAFFSYTSSTTICPGGNANLLFVVEFNKQPQSLGVQFGMTAFDYGNSLICAPFAIGNCSLLAGETVGTFYGNIGSGVPYWDNPTKITYDVL